jgi:iron-sulfur cluster assembly accessory protein
MNEKDFTITDEAAIALKDKFAAENKPKETFFRIGVSGGGCSGFEYIMDYDTEIDPKEDIVFEHEGVKVVIDQTSMPFVTGSKLKYIKDFIGSKFEIDNPQAKSSCGCGTSFSI